MEVQASGQSLPHERVSPEEALRNYVIDVTITATNRPGVLERTLHTFYKRMFKQWPTRIIINVDPIGEDSDPEIVLKTAMKFSPLVVGRIAEKPHFPTAFLWCWGQATSNFVFHLEDDWELVKDVNFERMRDLMERHPKLVSLRLPMWKTMDTAKNWSVFFPWNGEFFECPADFRGSLGFCGHPSLIRGWFVQYCRKYIDPTKNPEKQIKWRNRSIGPVLQSHHFGVFADQYSSAVIRDIGREWRERNRIGKKGNREHFTEWEKI